MSISFKPEKVGLFAGFFNLLLKYNLIITMTKKLQASFFIIFLFTGFVHAYNYIPFVKSYDKNAYNAGRQNWDVGTDSEGIVYFGNNEGLLRYIYGEWELAKTLNSDAVRSLCVYNDTIWCAGNREYGFFIKDSPENLKYHYLGDANSGLIWNTECDQNFVYFQSQDRIIVYDRQSEKSNYIDRNNGFWGLVKWNRNIWTLDKDGNFGILKGAEFNLVTKVENVLHGEIRKLFVHNGLLYVLDFDGRLFTYNEKELKQVELPQCIEGIAFFTGDTYKDNELLIGTITKGLFKVDMEKKTARVHIDRTNGLIDNTVLAIGKDINGNVWLGLDCGIAFLEMKNPIKTIFEGGATYSILDNNETTLLATNKGLFYSKGNDPFQMLEGSEGQNWRLRKINDQVYICHNKGLFSLTGMKMQALYTASGVMDIARFGDTPYFLLSAYSGLLLVKYQNGQFVFIENLNIWENPKIEYDQDNLCIWSDVKFYDLIQLKLNEENRVEKKTFSSIKTFFKGEDRFVFYDDQSLLEFKNGSFEPIQEKPFNLISGNNISILDFDKSYNFFAYVQNGYPNVLKNLQDGNFYSYQKLLSSLKNSLVKNDEFIQLHNGELRIATDRGVTTFNVNDGSLAPVVTKSVISKIIISDEDTVRTFTYPFVKEKIDLSRGQKSMIFYVGTNKSSSDLAEVRYRLWPYERDWNEWSDNRLMKEYSKVKGGNYKFQLQSRLNGVEIKDHSIDINIKEYWYQTNWKFVPIFLILAFISLIIIKIAQQRNEKNIKRERLLNKEKMAIQTLSLKNEQLLQYTEIISNKNKFLNKLKDGLSQMRNTEAKHWENRITEEVNKEKQNFLFHKLFSETHQDFINRLTEKHKDLTANDIRILSFIKINLGTREIANLMNISTKSVDISRYRLRKKLGLSHEDDLNKYIREI